MLQLDHNRDIRFYYFKHIVGITLKSLKLEKP